MNNNILEVKSLYKDFGKKEILKDVSFNMQKGDIIGFIGPNGSGKTTTIKLILGLQSITKGSVYINGYNIETEFVKAIEKVGAIVENPDMYMYLSGWQNLKLLAKLYPNITDNDINNLVKLVGLEKRIKEPCSKYSLGMRQRLGIARSLLNKPNILILDEPTNGLDPKGIKELRDLLKKLASEGMGILISSHNLAELESFCNKIVIIDKGVITNVSKVDEFKKDENRYKFVVNNTKNINFDNIESVTKDSFIIQVEKENIPKIVRKLVKDKIDIYEIIEEKLTLEEAFFMKTGGKK